MILKRIKYLFCKKKEKKCSEGVYDIPYEEFFIADHESSSHVYKDDEEVIKEIISIYYANTDKYNIKLNIFLYRNINKMIKQLKDNHERH